MTFQSRPTALTACQTPIMSFSIQRPTVDQHLAFSDHDQYTFEANGVLKVATGARITYYSPGAWEWVSSTDGHLPGTRRTG